MLPAPNSPGTYKITFSPAMWLQVQVHVACDNYISVYGKVHRPQSHHLCLQLYEHLAD